MEAGAGARRGRSRRRVPSCGRGAAGRGLRPPPSALRRRSRAPPGAPPQPRPRPRLGRAPPVPGGSGRGGGAPASFSPGPSSPLRSLCSLRSASLDRVPLRPCVGGRGPWRPLGAIHRAPALPRTAAPSNAGAPLFCLCLACCLLPSAGHEFIFINKFRGFLDLT